MCEAALKAAGFRGVATNVLVPEWERDHPTKPGERQSAILDLGLLCQWSQEYVDFHVFHCFKGDGNPQDAGRDDAAGHEALKDQRYKAHGPRASPHSLVPMVFNAYGGLGKRGLAALKRWAAASQGRLNANELLSFLSLAVTRRVGGQVLAGLYGRGQRVTPEELKRARAGRGRRAVA